MAELVVRNLEEDVKARLQARARRRDRSLEAVVRDTLRNAAKAEERPVGGLGSEIAARFPRTWVQRRRDTGTARIPDPAGDV